MKINSFETDIQPEDLAVINKPDTFRDRMTNDDTLISKELPIVIKYDYIDLGITDYHFKQFFQLRDTQEYFGMMKVMSSNTINALEEKSRRERGFHFYRSGLNGNVRRAIKKLLPDADDDLIVYHFGLYECDSRQASRETGERSPRIYFLLGSNGFVYILFFDPFHELNPV